MKICLREPIASVWNAARYLDAAVTADLAGDTALAEHLLQRANDSAVREWLDSVWGKSSPYVKVRKLPRPQLANPPALKRTPTTEQIQQLHARDGFTCRYCGIPVIRAEIRQLAVPKYPHAVTWGRTNATQHAGFQAMWAQYDHVRPHAWGGNNDLDNLVVACAACNYEKVSYSLEELDLLAPRDRAPVITAARSLPTLRQRPIYERNMRC